LKQLIFGLQIGFHMDYYNYSLSASDVIAALDCDLCLELSFKFLGFEIILNNRIDIYILILLNNLFKSITTFYASNCFTKMNVSIKK
jgi:hypothetical protein